MRERFIIFLIGLLGFNSLVKAQQAYFIDGYHGGVYGHYPMGQTSFIVQKLKQYPFRTHRICESYLCPKLFFRNFGRKCYPSISIWDASS